jgi:hypothetical protein
MKLSTLSLIAAVSALAFTASAQFTEKIVETTDSLTFGRTADKVGFYGVTPVVKRTGSAQAAITDNTTGSAGNTLAAGTGVMTIPIPIQLASMTTSAADLITAYTPGFAGKILSADFVTTTLGTGSGATQAINLEVGTTNLTGGVVTVTLASTDTLGEISAGTAVTAANTFTASDSISIEVAAGGTVFTAGSGVLLLRVQNTDTADAAASLAAKWNEVRATLVALGLFKGSS